MKTVELTKGYITIEYLISFVTVICGIVGLVMLNTFGGYTVLNVTCYVVQIFAGIITAILTYRGIYCTIATVCATLGLSLMVRFGYIFYSTLVGDIEDPLFVRSVISFLIMVFGALMLYSSIRLLMGHRRNAGRLAVYLAAPIILCLVAAVYMVVHNGSSLLSVLIAYHHTIPPLVLDIFLEVALFQTNLISKSSVSKVKGDVEVLSTNTHTLPETAMKRKELVHMLRCVMIHDKWENSDGVDSGHFTVTIGKKKTQRVLLFKRFDETDTVTVTVLPKSYEGYINAFHFKLMSIEPVGGSFKDCQKIRIFGENGIFIDILISDTETAETELDDDATFTEALDHTLRHRTLFRTGNKKSSDVEDAE